MKRIASLIVLSVSFCVARVEAEGPTAPPTTPATPSGAPTASAPETPQSTTYDQLIEQGESALIGSDWQRCLELFERAHKINPSAVTYIAIGRCALERQDYVTALHHLQEGMHYPLSEVQRARAQDMYAMARRNLGRYVIELDPPNASLQVDGVPAVFESNQVLWLVIGQHRLQVRALGYAPLEQRLEVKPNDDRAVQLRLSPEARAAAVGPVANHGNEVKSPAEKPESGTESSSSSTLQWIALGSSGAVVVAGGVFLGIALASKSKVENADGESLKELEPAHDRVPLFSTIGGVMIGVGVAGVGATLAWMLMSGKEEQAVSLRVGPGGAAVRGVF
jgi:tetratricopeptide (TPR) repeat protein